MRETTKAMKTIPAKTIRGLECFKMPEYNINPERKIAVTNIIE
jgi:hypothetical protein